MKRWFVWVFILCLLGLIALGINIWLTAPQVWVFSPPKDASDVQVRSAIHITFSQPMRRDTVEKRLSTDPPRTGKFEWIENTLIFTPDQPWPGGVVVQVRLQAGGRADGRIGLPIWQGFSWSFKTAQSLLAYLWPSEGPADLYILDPLSGEVRRLTEGANVLDYSVSLDGLSIFFSGGNTSTGTDIYILDLVKAAVGSTHEEYVENVLDCQQVSCRSPQVSPDGKWLAYERLVYSEQGSSEVWLLNIATQEARRLGENDHFTKNPSWSVDNLLAYYDQQLAGYLFYDVKDGEEFLAPNTTGEPGVWAPDGSAYLAAEIIYSQSRTGQTSLGSSHLIRYNPFGSSLDMTQAMNLEDTFPAYSPDSRTIAFARKYLEEPLWSFGRQLWLMNANGEQPRQITQDDLYNHFDIAWSWDGRWMAYVRFENASYSSQVELWLREADGSNPVQLNFGGYSPQWIP